MIGNEHALVQWGGALAAGLAVGGAAWASQSPSSALFGSVLTAPRNPGKGKAQIALTFDDGPHPRWTPMLLEILARHNIRATFFVLGKYAEGQRPLLQEMHRAGHLIGNHTWTHPNLAFAGSRRTRDELFRTSTELEQIIASPVFFFRPPFGGRSPTTMRIARQLRMVPVLWNAMTADWSATAPERISTRLAKLVERHRRHGRASNVVLHDGSHRTLETDRSASVACAAQLIERFAASSRFVTLEEWDR